MRDVAAYASESNCSLAILSLDQEKAFDCVNWSFLYSTLSKMGFGPSFIRWVQLLYSDVQSSVLNSYTTKPFKPSRGVQQVGLSIPRSPTLPVLSLYADDTSVVVSSNRAIVPIFETYDRFEKASGSKINLAKCEGLWLGSWQHRLDAPVAIRWTLKIKVLHVFIGNGNLDEANWRPHIDAVEKCLSSWCLRSLSF